jgi:hypothetical protein
MKIKKEYIILVVIIAALSIYLALREKDRTHYELPAVESIDGEKVTRILIARPGDVLTVERRNERWIIEPGEYPADGGKVDEMLKALSEFTLTSLVAESENYSQYDLVEDKRIAIEAFAGEQSLIKFDIGKTASTYRHTYVKLSDDEKVYQARSNIRRVFEPEMDKLRDRNVLKIDRSAITGLSVKSGTETISLEKFSRPSEPVEEGGIPPAEVTSWITPDSTEADSKVIDTILGRTVNLQCDGFPESGTRGDLGVPSFVLAFKGTDMDTLYIYGQNEEDKKYLAASSQYRFPFMLSEWKVNNIKKSPGEIMGEETEENTGGE